MGAAGVCSQSGAVAVWDLSSRSLLLVARCPTFALCAVSELWLTSAAFGACGGGAAAAGAAGEERQQGVGSGKKRKVNPLSDVGESEDGSAGSGEGAAQAAVAGARGTALDGGAALATAQEGPQVQQLSGVALAVRRDQHGLGKGLGCVAGGAAGGLLLLSRLREGGFDATFAPLPALSGARVGPYRVILTPLPRLFPQLKLSKIIVPLLQTL